MVHLARFPVRHGLTISAILYMAVTGLTWAASTPPGGVPDEPSHVVYATAVVRGDLGEPTELDDPLYSRLMGVEVPAWVATISVCYRWVPTVTADCQPGITDKTEEVIATTTATKYPPPYYAIVGLPTWFMTGAPAFYAMRVVSVMLGVAIVGLGLAVATPARRWWLTLGVLLAFTPTVGHFLGSVNPHGMEILLALALGVALLGLAYESQSQRRVWFEATAISVVALLLAWARPWSSVVMIAVAMVAVLANWSSVRRWTRTNSMAATVIGAVMLLGVLTALFFEFQVRDPAEASVISHFAQFTHPFTQNLNTVLELSGSWLLADVGQFGWLDHGAPSLVQFTWLGFLAAFTLWALATSQSMLRLVLLVTIIGAAFIAPLFIIEFIFGSLEGYQARYNLPVLVLVPLLAFFAFGSQGIRLTELSPVSRAASWFAGLAPFMVAVSVVFSIARYSIGAPFGWADVVTGRFLTEGSWIPPGEALSTAIFSLVVLVSMAPVLWSQVRCGPVSRTDPAGLHAGSSSLS